MDNGDMPAAPCGVVYETCGLDGNSGPDLVQHEYTGLTKREAFAMAAMTGLLSDTEHMASITNTQGAEMVTLILSRTAVLFADHLLQALEDK